MASSFEVTPIGVVLSATDAPLDDVWGGAISRIELDAARFTRESLAGLDGFSHVEIIFVFDRVADSEIEYGGRHPRGRKDWPFAGIFAQRGKNRPNRLGVTVCRLIAVGDLHIDVEALDAIDGTPVLDIKPYMREFGPKGDVRQPAWASELMVGYWNPPAKK